MDVTPDFTWLWTSRESPFTSKYSTPKDRAFLSPAMSALYFATHEETPRPTNFLSSTTVWPRESFKTAPMPPWLLGMSLVTPSKYKIHGDCGWTLGPITALLIEWGMTSSSKKIHRWIKFSHSYKTNSRPHSLMNTLHLQVTCESRSLIIKFVSPTQGLRHALLSFGRMN